MDQAVKHFFSSPKFAVAGANQDPSRFGYKVLAWYHRHSLPAIPINPRTPTITIPPSTTLTSISSPTHLPDPTTTSLSIITPPAVTKSLLLEAKKIGIPAIWLQPGTFDNEVLEICRKDWEGRWVGGTEDGGGDANGGEGWCVLVHGDWGLGLAGRSGGKL